LLVAKVIDLSTIIEIFIAQLRLSFKLNRSALCHNKRVVDTMFNALTQFLTPGKNPDITPAFEYQNNHLPTLWLLGKTGAGKSSLIQAITGDSDVEVGNGFEPCTMTSKAYDFPLGKPLLRFLDTRGLSEADYDPQQDIALSSQQGHALLLIAKAEEPEQSEVLNALSKINNSTTIKHVIVVHTAIKQLPEQDRKKAIAYNQQQFEQCWGGKIPSVAVDFELADGSRFGVDELGEKIGQLLPIVSQLMDKQQHSDAEEANFKQLKSEILWYASSAGATDAVPTVGLIAVPSIQAKMLYSLASQYGIKWNKKTFGELLGTLGTGFAVQYAAKMGIRQLVKFIPVYGQTVGSASAAVVSFTSTYAIGRVACKYMYHKGKNERVSNEEMQSLYRDALSSIKEIAEQ